MTKDELMNFMQWYAGDETMSIERTKELEQVVDIYLSGENTSMPLSPITLPSDGVVMGAAKDYANKCYPEKKKIAERGFIACWKWFGAWRERQVYSYNQSSQKQN